MNFDNISSPTLLVDEKTCRQNIRRMASKAKKHSLTFKPHFKTHQSAEIGAWFRDHQIDAITVSSLQMAEYFANHGWEDITVAFPVNVRAIRHINSLAQQVSLSLLLSNSESLEYLAKHLTSGVNIYLEIDTGDHRTGLDPSNMEYIHHLYELISDTRNMHFSGFYSHPGHSYACRGKEDVRQLHQQVVKKIQKLRHNFKPSSHSYSVCIGDTPCCSLADDFEGIDEMSPGNFVFYDLMQAQIGSCSLQDIAVVLASPVVAKHESRQQIIIHAGAVHLSKERISEGATDHFGLPVALHNKGWKYNPQGSYLSSVSQEHGILQCSPAFFDAVSVGDLIGILPVHSCLAANLSGGFTDLSGKALGQCPTNYS